MPPLERLKYFPGQRLDAVDLNLEANYELTVRRLLNQGLFTPGVVSGLEVKQASARQVNVLPGLALDIQGRELYVSDPLLLDLPNQKPAGGGDTYYLLITYDEQQVAASDGGCTASNGGKTFSRIRQVPYLAFTSDWPNPQLCSNNFRDLNCGTFLASVTLDDSCQLASIDTGLRQYSYPAHSSQVHEASYEGEKDIAPGESKRLFFHIRGGSPHGVTLHLRGAQFSRLWYTELGDHSHSFTAKANTLTGPSAVDISHAHDISGITDDITKNDENGHDGTHHHQILAHDNTFTGKGILTSTLVPPSDISHTHLSDVPPLPTGPPIPVGLALPSKIGYRDNNVGFDGRVDKPWISDSDHHHKIDISGQTTNSQSPVSSPNHAHSFDPSGATIGDTGVTDVAARAGLSYSTIADLQVKLNDVDITQNILDQIRWTSLGGPAFDTKTGTGGIDLLRLPLVKGQPKPPDLVPGPVHVLEFSVKSGGGKLLYNLYIE